MRYSGQQSEVTVPLEGDPGLSATGARLRARSIRPTSLYGVRLDDVDVEVVSYVRQLGGETERISVTLSKPGSPGPAGRCISRVGT
jgi:hypothetical protein